MRAMTLRVLVSVLGLVAAIGATGAAESGAPAEVPMIGPALARDAAGHLYLAGHADETRVFLTRLDPAGAVLLRTELDGFDAGAPLALAVTPAGEAVVAGSGGGDAMLVRVAADGRTAVSRAVFGGKGLDAALAVALDADGNAWVAGRTASADLRAEGALTGVADAFLAEVDPAGTVLYATYLGGAQADEARGVALDKDGAVYVTGSFGSDAFLAKFAPKSATLVYTTPFGSSRDSVGVAVAVMPSGDVMVAGTTRTADGGEAGAFLTAIDPVSGVLRSSTDAGVAVGDGALALAVDRQGAAWIAGTRAKDAVAWRVETDVAGSIRTELMAGESDDLASGVVVDGNGDAWVAGLTRSATLRDVTRPERALGGDVFLAHVAGPASPQGVCPGTKNFTGATSLDWGTGTNWSGGTVPVATDDVCISGFNVTVASGSQLAGTLRVENGSLTIGSGTLTVSGASEINGPLTVSAGTLTGAGNLTVSGLFTWSGGTLSGAGTFTTNGTTSVSGTSSKLLSRLWNVNANVTWTGSGSMSLTSGIVINNAATWDSQVGSNSISGGNFNNSGTFKKSAGAGITSLATSFNNTGSVLVQVATLDFAVAGSSTGSFDVASGATLRFSSGTFQINAGTAFTGAGTVSPTGLSFVSFNTAITIPASLTVNLSGEITGTGTLAIAGTLNWSTGKMSGAGVTTCNGPVNLSGTTPKSLDTRTLNLNAGAVLTGTGNLAVGFAAVINSPGTFDCQSDASLASAGGAVPTFNNSGTFKKSAGTGTTSVQIQFNNSGSALVQSGKLNLSAGGTMTGAFNLSAGTTLEFSGAQSVFNAGTTFTGTGNLLQSGGNFRVSSPVTIPASLTFDMTGGNVLGTATLTFGGTFNWSGGTQQELGTTTFNGALNISGTAGLTVIQRVLNANGATTYTGTGTLTLSVGAVINNNGTWDVQSDATIAQGGAPESSFKNFATLKKSAGAGTMTVGGTFTNSGTVDVQSGTLNAASYSQTAGTTKLTGGAFSSAANIAIAGGTLAGSGTVSGPVVVSGTGALAPGLSAGTLSLGGNYTQQAPNGAFNVEIGGLTPGTQHDRVDVTGVATLAGVLNVSLIGGFVPAPDDVFLIMTYASRTGTFTPNLPAVACINWQVDYQPNWVRLVAAAAPRPTEITQLMSPSKTTLTWAAGSEAGIVYDVMRGALSTLPVGPGAGETCLATGIASAAANDPATPAAGTGFWYVVRGRVPACGTGTYGFATGGIERISTACP